VLLNESNRTPYGKLMPDILAYAFLQKIKRNCGQTSLSTVSFDEPDPGSVGSKVEEKVLDEERGLP
jgi:hypothetical protein